ncbi:virulence factor Pgp3 [Chlamydia pecorum]|uniref:Virulence plasmid protein pGP3-D n=1 Tax=Chlamydia pecorum TaxID=85991 RepID=A0A0N6WZM4_9CHLA|nr:virulence factor Pgp3 [Chlamydia pecorum]ALF35202.1 Virulence plasmid protein pGP3-D [Chlamydia pecorum]ALF35210.1 Virulence plasmid protein pGP3-D [Chlamydia pecorum]ALF35218.1 Virulence plasmid protein pGP3-D [Chlamydia pecorum]ALF35226.1 Virulence plasmid protein pGP3-D [Chlamydia pecorum]ALF35234.1 Virulence plasmid protein pGP3-D [Chlamydia pecorum]
MGNSGFYLNNNQNCVFADNIRLGQMTNELQDKQIIIGTPTTPTVTSLSSSNNGIIINQNTATTPATIEFSLDTPKIAQAVLESVTNDIMQEIVSNLSQELIEDVLEKIDTDSSFSFSRAFKAIEIKDCIQCNGLFTSENIGNLLGGTEIAKFTVTPENANSAFLIDANIIASRMEGAVVLALVKEGNSSPSAISYGFSSGLPNVCSLKAVIENTTTTPATFSLRIGGMESGVVWVNAMPNGNKILNAETTSTISVLEVIPQTNG